VLCADVASLTDEEDDVDEYKPAHKKSAPVGSGMYTVHAR